MVDSNDLRDARDAAHSKGKSAGQSVEQSRAYQILVRVGLVCYGVVHLVIAWVAVQLAFGIGGDSGEASDTGALRTLAEQPFGQVLMWVIAAGFATLVIWQLLQAVFGHRQFDGFKRIRKRVSSGAKAILYAVLGFSAGRLAMGGGSGGGGDTEQSITGRLMGMPFGRALVFVLALAVMAVGVGQIVKGIRQKFTEELEGHPGRAAIRFGTFGYIAKGISIFVMGTLFGWAAISYDAEKAGGTDDALRTILEQPFGPFLLALVALGLAAFGIYCFYWARHAKLSKA